MHNAQSALGDSVVPRQLAVAHTHIPLPIYTLPTHSYLLRRALGHHLCFLVCLLTCLSTGLCYSSLCTLPLLGQLFLFCLLLPCREPFCRLLFSLLDLLLLFPT